MSDYISRKAFKEKYLCCGYLPEMSEKEFDEFPTADVKPVRHGRWEKRGCSWYCTYCGVGYRITYRSIPASRHKYCPNCGADMREGEHE